MSFAKSSKKKEDVEQSGGGKYINASGIYPVNTVAPFVSVSNGGSESVDFLVNHKDQEQVIYGNLRVSNNDGQANAIGSKVFNQLMIIAGIDDCADPVDGELPIGQKGKMKEAAILESLCDLDVLMRVQMEYSAHNGNIQEKKVIKGFYRAEDGATAEEIVNESDAGAGYEADQKYVNNVTYKDDINPEQIEQWIKAKRPKGTAGDTANTGSGKETAPKFGTKRRFGKNADES